MLAVSIGLFWCLVNASYIYYEMLNNQLLFLQSCSIGQKTDELFYGCDIKSSNVIRHCERHILETGLN